MNPPMIRNTAFAAALLAGLFTGPALAQSTRHTRTVCEDVVVRDQPKDKHQIAGTAIGAVAGGLLGHQVGGGKGKTLATVGGAVAGGYAGKKVQEHQQDKRANTHVERRCREVRD
ncbi:glycine zipper 2TM domain-containing protein [Frateuria defendens]|uniref:glycine zipper 2TM domain-containing protein n=1 Tax=Frateuria defendens TaxID=2219559 RepID=UPI000A7D6237